MRMHVAFHWEKFLRSVDRKLLRRFFDWYKREHKREHGRPCKVFDGLSFGARAKAYIGSIPDLCRRYRSIGREVEGWLKLINDLNTPRGRACLQRAVVDHGIRVRYDSSPPDLAMRLFLDHRQALDEVLAIYRVEQTDNWRLFRGKEPREPKLTPRALKRAAADLREVLWKRRMSRECFPRHIPQQEREIIEFLHEDYSEAIYSLRGEEMRVEWRRPVRHPTAIYRASTGVIKVKVFRDDDLIRDRLLRAIGTHLFGEAGFFLGPDAEMRLDLTRLRERPDLSTQQQDGITRVDVIALELRRVGTGTATARFGATDTDSMYSLLQEFAPNPEQVNVRHARMRFKFAGKRNAGQRTITLTEPNSSNLGDDDYDRIIEKCLCRWGLMNGPEPPEADFAADRAARQASLDMGRPPRLPT